MVTMGMVGSSNKIRSKHIFQWKKKESPLDSNRFSLAEFLWEILYSEKCVDLVDRYGISVSQITTDMLHLS
jgi:hypothetical protein